MKHRLCLLDWKQWAAIGLVLAAFGAMACNASAQSPTMDEQNHIARGYVFLRTGDPRLSLEHPPLINSLEALPLLMLPNVRIPTDDWSWEVGEWYRFADLFMWQKNHTADRMVYLARLPVIALTLLLAALAARWARQLWGQAGALLALALVLLDPNLLAHGSLATTDMGQTLAVFAAGYVAWRAPLQLSPRPTHSTWRAIYPTTLAGIVMGLMLATKISALAFVGVFGALLIGDGITSDGIIAPVFRINLRAWIFVTRRLLSLMAMTIIALLVLWAAYAFQVAPAIEGGPSLPMGTYWKGVLSIFQQSQGGRPSYLLGQTSVHGWWSYFPIAFAVKTPLPILLLLLLAIPAALVNKRWRASLFLLAPVLAYWALVIQSALNIGYRHLLPTLPFLYVWAAQISSLKIRPSNKPPTPYSLRPTSSSLISHLSSLISHLSSLIPLLLCWLALEIVFIAPHFLSYFNQLGGGPSNGWKIIADSNMDWGQDLKYLRAYQQNNHLGKIKLSWFGSSYPTAYGIDYEPLPGLPHHFDLWANPPFDPQNPAPGVYVISVSNLVEIPFQDKWVYAYFRARPPDERIGYSIYIYKVGQ